VVSGHVDLVVLERRGGQGNVRLPPFRGGDRRPRLTGRSGLAEAVDEFDEALAAAGAHIEAAARLGQFVEADLVEVPRRIIGDESTVQRAEVPPRHRRSVMDPGPPLVALLWCLVAGATAVGIFGHVHTPLPDGARHPRRHRCRTSTLGQSWPVMYGESLTFCRISPDGMSSMRQLPY